jgi:hypothetical protein
VVARASPTSYNAEVEHVTRKRLTTVSPDPFDEPGGVGSTDRAFVVD